MQRRGDLVVMSDHRATNQKSKGKAVKVVVNRCFGGFGLSHRAVMRYAELKGMKLYPWLDDITRSVYKDRAVVGNDELSHNYSTVPVDPNTENWADETYFAERDIDRSDPALVQAVEELGDAASGPHARLAVVEVPADVDWEITEYDGSERVEEKHRSW